MKYDELVLVLYQIARESDDRLFEEQMVDLGWTVNQQGIHNGEDFSEDGLRLRDLTDRLEVIGDIAQNVMDKVKVDELRNELLVDGVEVYVQKYKNY